MTPNRSLLISVLFLCSIAIAQESITITSDPKDPSRPISTLLDQLREKGKIPVTYEDPRYANTADTSDVTAEIARDPAAAARSGHRTLVPKGRAISFVYSPKNLRNPEQAQAVVSRMLKEYRSVGGQTFAVIREGGRLHVVPVDVLNVEGNRTKQGSILDTVVSIPAGPRDGAQLLQTICDELKKQTGFEVGIGPSAPSNNLEGYRTAEGIDAMSARSAIERVLDKASPASSYVWDLYYDPGDKSYGLNFSYIGKAESGATR